MALTHSLLLFPLLLIFLVIHPALCDPQTQELIDKICRQMEEYGFCNNVFHENLKGPSTDLTGLTQITIDQASKNATGIHDLIVSLLSQATDDPSKNALVACENGYKIVVQSFQQASASFTQKDYDRMLKAEQGAPKAQASCEVTYKTPPYPLNPLVDRNRQMRILIAMAVVTGHYLVP